jgi:hypothetical protein
VLLALGWVLGPGPERIDAQEVSAPDSTFFFVKGRDYGTDAVAGPLNAILNKGFAVAQWEGSDRAIFSYPYGWRAVWNSVRDPGPAMERAGGWSRVLRRHVVPLAGDEFRDGQWVPNYFGHVLEGGLTYRGLLEWNRLKGVPLPTLSALIVTQFAAVVNEAYETPVGPDPWVQDNGTAGTFMDLALFDPLGMFLFHHDGVARFYAQKLGGTLWPRQGSIALPGGLVMNNGQGIVMRLGLGFTDKVRLFFRGGVGAQAGLSFPRDDGLEVALSVGAESYSRVLSLDDQVESAKFGLTAGLWVDRGGSLLMSATWDFYTDRRLSVDVFPGIIKIGGFTPGVWLVVNNEGRPFLGLTGRRTLGAGLGIGF